MINDFYSEMAMELELKKFFEENDRFARHCGIELLEIAPGGALFTLPDFTFAAASNSHGTIAVAINANIAFTKAVTGGSLLAEAKEISLSPKLSTYLITITDESGDVVASFQGTSYRKKDSIIGTNA